jgi:dihydrofolate reductase
VTLCVDLVVAVSDNDVIGRGNRLPWRMPADLRRFKELTLGSPVLMGRKTHESIGRALPGRLNLVLTRGGARLADGAIGVCTLAEAALAAGEAAATRLMVIGGAEVYRLCLPSARRIELTIVHTRIDDGDAWFDGWRAPEWREVARERHAADADNAFDYSFVVLERPPPPADSATSAAAIGGS